MDGQPLKPLTHGNILIVGAKPSNFGQEILTHPRVIIWNSQQEHWTNKDLPSNIQAVFVTRWIGHASFNRIITEARKRHITMFNPEGTGMIAKQVKELLAMTKPVETVHVTSPFEPGKIHHPITHKGSVIAKLHVLLQYVDWDKSNTENAKEMIKMLDHHGITSTLPSLANFVGVQRKKLGITTHTRNTHAVRKAESVSGRAIRIPDSGLDVSVQMLDDAIKSLQDMRAYLISTTQENKALKAKLDKFKKMVEEG